MLPHFICASNLNIFIEEDWGLLHVFQSIWVSGPSVHRWLQATHTWGIEISRAWKTTFDPFGYWGRFLCFWLTSELIFFLKNIFSVNTVVLTSAYLNGFGYCICFWTSFPVVLVFTIALSSFCFSCLRMGGCAANGRTWWFSPREQWKCLSTYWKMTFCPLLYF